MNQDTVGAQPRRSVGDEFDGAGAHVIDRLRRLDSRGTYGLARGCIHARRRRFLNHLLVAALQGTIALEQMHDIAVHIAENLNLDVPWREDIFLDQHAVIAE